MASKIDRRSVSLLELFRRAKRAEHARRGQTAPETRDTSTQSQGDIVSPRDERGTPYPGDFPNDLARHYRGCF
jgi:uncharacterized protein YijF (DUF1287 family)